MTMRVMIIIRLGFVRVETTQVNVRRREWMEVMGMVRMMRMVMRMMTVVMIGRIMRMVAVIARLRSLQRKLASRIAKMTRRSSRRELVGLGLRSLQGRFV